MTQATHGISVADTLRSQQVTEADGDGACRGCSRALTHAVHLLTLAIGCHVAHTEWESSHSSKIKLCALWLNLHKTTLHLLRVP